jgi:hypothetical protein
MLNVRRLCLNLFIFGILTTLLPFQGNAEEEILLAPSPSPSNIKLKVEFVAHVTNPGNVGSPVSYGFDELLAVNQGEGKIISYCTKNDATECPSPDRLSEIFNPSISPKEITLVPFISVINAVGIPHEDTLYVAFTSFTLPKGIPVHYLPFPDDPAGGVEDFPFIDIFPASNGGTGPLLNQDIYRIGAPNYSLFGEPQPMFNVYQVIYEFKYKNGKLNSPKPIVALESQFGPTHFGGAMELDPFGRIIFATGDNLPFGMEGRKAPQLDDNHVGKILLIDPKNGDVKVAAKGVRNPQHFQVTYFPFGIAFGDIGGVTAEELNFLSFREMLDTREVENFGWGRNPDGKAREGTFYVSQGNAFVLGTEPAPESIAPVPEEGFKQPIAQYGRPEFSLFTFAAISGPVVSYRSFDQLSSVVADLPSGSLFGTTALLNHEGSEFFQIQLVDEEGQPLGPNNSLNDLLGGRVDPRLFTFPDGKAGVLLEATGDIYRLTEVE